MPRLIITGGRQRSSLRDLSEWELCDEARIVQVDTQAGTTVILASHRTPAGEIWRDRPNHAFKSATWSADRLWVVSHTEVLSFDRTFRLTERFSHPWFNDLHHVAPIDGRLHVVSTGLDSVLVLDERREVVEVHHALGGTPWERFDPSVDYRCVMSTKPHAAHPNFVFTGPGGRWVTRFVQMDAVCLDDPARRITLEAGKPHDGVYVDGSIWFTTVNGMLVRADARSGTVTAQHDLNQMEDAPGPLGWCRGLWVEGAVAYVGFSRIRPTKIRENLSWIKHGFQVPDGYQTRPTRIAAYDLQQRSKIDEWDLEGTGLNSLFGILPSP